MPFSLIETANRFRIYYPIQRHIETFPFIYQGEQKTPVIHPRPQDKEWERCLMSHLTISLVTACPKHLHQLRVCNKLKRIVKCFNWEWIEQSSSASPHLADKSESQGESGLMSIMWYIHDIDQFKIFLIQCSFHYAGSLF